MIQGSVWGQSGSIGFKYKVWLIRELISAGTKQAQGLWSIVGLDSFKVVFGLRFKHFPAIPSWISSSDTK